MVMSEEKMQAWVERLLADLPQFQEMGAQVKQKFRMHAQKILLDLECVPWDEFAAVQTLALHLQQRVQQLTERVAALEAAQKK
jgi:BMFP domain-containing protein YqiC